MKFSEVTLCWKKEVIDGKIWFDMITVKFFPYITVKDTAESNFS